MPRCLTHKEVQDRFVADLRALCMKHDVVMTAGTQINVSIKPVYDPNTNLYREYGADFSIGTQFPEANKDYRISEFMRIGGCVAPQPKQDEPRRI